MSEVNVEKQKNITLCKQDKLRIMQMHGMPSKKRERLSTLPQRKIFSTSIVFMMSSSWHTAVSLPARRRGRARASPSSSVSYARFAARVSPTPLGASSTGFQVGHGKLHEVCALHDSLHGRPCILLREQDFQERGLLPPPQDTFRLSGNASQGKAGWH